MTVVSAALCELAKVRSTGVGSDKVGITEATLDDVYSQCTDWLDMCRVPHQCSNLGDPGNS
jgi:hypothetical protein